MVFDTRGMMRKFLKGAMVLIIFFVITIPSFNVWFWFDRQKLYEELLPKKLEISGSISNIDSNIFDTCFFAVYRLSDTTVNRINQEGLVFFDDAIRSRGYFYRRSMGMYDSYAQWQQSPIKNTDKNRTFGSGLNCAERLGFDKSLLKKIELASYERGSFYTGHREGQLVVMPSLGVAVISGAGG